MQVSDITKAVSPDTFEAADLSAGCVQQGVVVVEQARREMPLTASAVIGLSLMKATVGRGHARAIR